MAEVVGRLVVAVALVLQKGPPVGLYVGTMESCRDSTCVAWYLWSVWVLQANFWRLFWVLLTSFLVLTANTVKASHIFGAMTTYLRELPMGFLTYLAQ